MRKNFPSWITSLLLLLTFSYIPNAEGIESKTHLPSEVSQNSKRQSYDQDDHAYQRRGRPGKARIALNRSRESFRSHPKDPEAAWRLSRVCSYFGQKVAKSKELQRRILREGKNAAKTGLENDANCAACHYWLAKNMTLLAELGNSISALLVIHEIESQLKKSIAADPGYDMGAAYRLKGYVEAHLRPGVFGGDNEEAKGYFETALRIGPKDPRNHLALAELLAEGFNDHEAAVRQAEAGLALPRPRGDDIEKKEAFRGLKKLVRQLKPRLKKTRQKQKKQNYSK